ncbi:M15 family metallopeptidase [Geomicrobium sp. JCM 19038]|uniref:M15 family metallopeptidase n=1 Tax=Geomicrobium sp. JCM 19038 TaxID=1460635 RepID=UPI00045F272E|nr:M15 family metallopeptidase [Geomicrobium sp. JCM 19038]GAK10126.1 L-alanoyl-D-glutamate peptidase [Geomicrobium sp. JCM 19038]
MRAFLSFLFTLSFVFVIFFVIHFYEEQQSERKALAEEIIVEEELHREIVSKKETLIDQASEIGITIVITDGYRTFAEQDELYARGRQDDGQIVTHAQGGESYHNYGLAIDYALMNDAGEVIWDIDYDGNGNGKSDWYEVAEIAESLGFEWGGRWTHFPDYPHLQMTFDFSIRELQEAHETVHTE